MFAIGTFYLQSKVHCYHCNNDIKDTLAYEQALRGVQGWGWGWGRKEGKEGVMDERTTDVPSYNIY